MDVEGLTNVIEGMSLSIASVRESVRELREKQNDLDMKDGISLLTLKNYTMISYLQSLLLVSSRRALGHSLSARAPPSEPFSDEDRSVRGSGAGDLVDSMIENRIVLEKIKILEGRMRYQIEKLVKLAEQPSSASGNVVDDPLAFRPNPQNLLDNDGEPSDEESDAPVDDGARRRDGEIYRPPKLAPVPYTETSRKDKRDKRGPIPNALTSLLDVDPSRPHAESTSGLGTTPSLASARARELNRITEYEEENFTRLMMKKKDHTRRLRDEEDIALGGSASVGGSTGKTRRRGGGFEDEFNDVLKNVGRTRGPSGGDGYDDLRQRGKKASVLHRSRSTLRTGTESSSRTETHEEVQGKKRKRSRFEADMKTTKKRIARSQK